MGRVIGIIIAKVPQLVPVAKAIRALRINTNIGRIESGKLPFTNTSLRYTESPSPPSDGLLLIIPPIVHANVRITRAGAMVFIPSKRAVELSLILNNLRAR